ncbi:MAG: hypothetical protein JW955_11975 [Sedimentisphaerales bacterium]|nr:hypothetical protein [Sedimentisphaerales bacterium]
MRPRQLLSLLAATAVLVPVPPQASAQTPVGTAFTYQGRLTDGGSPANGQYDLQFTLYDAEIDGNTVGNPVGVEDQQVTSGLFTMRLDFGAGVFTGDARWLQIAVRPGNSSDPHTPLSPRQALTPTPYALQTRGIFVDDAGHVGIGENNPAAPLEIAVDGPGGLAVELRQRAADQEVHINLENNSGFWHISGPRSFEPFHQLGFFWNDNITFHHVMSLQANGNVGIGTDSPDSPLTVAGAIESTTGGFKFPDGSVQSTAAGSGLWTPSGSNIFYTAGSVGIGTMGDSLTISDTLVPKGERLDPARGRFPCATDPATGKIYCFGGWDGAGLIGDIVEYDPRSDTLRDTGASLPWGLAEFQCAADPATRKIYCFGGFDGNGYRDEILAYDPAYPEQDAVDTGARLPLERENAACAFSPATGKIYCFGGDTEPILNEILAYDPAYPEQDAVDTGAKLPTGGRESMACAADPATGKIYCFGGDNDDGDTVFDEILEYDPAYPEQDALVVAHLPEARTSMGAAMIPGIGKIYCFGGVNLTTAFHEILEYDPDNPTQDAVVMTARLPSDRFNLASAAVAETGKIYSFGGQEGTAPVNEILEYTPPSHILLQVGEPGDGTAAIANSWAVFSSREFKRDIAALEPPEYQDILAKLTATEVVRYRYAYDKRRTQHLGVIAEESPAEILSPGGKAVSLADYTTFLMAAVKAQQAVIEEKESQIADLQTQMAETQRRLASLESLVNSLEQRQIGGAR